MGKWRRRGIQESKELGVAEKQSKRSLTAPSPFDRLRKAHFLGQALRQTLLSIEGMESASPSCALLARYYNPLLGALLSTYNNIVKGPSGIRASLPLPHHPSGIQTSLRSNPEISILIVPVPQPRVSHWTYKKLLALTFVTLKRITHFTWPVQSPKEGLFFGPGLKAYSSSLRLCGVNGQECLILNFPYLFPHTFFISKKTIAPKHFLSSMGWVSPNMEVAFISCLETTVDKISLQSMVVWSFQEKAIVCECHLRKELSVKVAKYPSTYVYDTKRKVCKRPTLTRQKLEAVGSRAKVKNNKDKAERELLLVQGRDLILGKEVETCFLQGAKVIDRNNSSLEQSLNAELGFRLPYSKLHKKAIPSPGRQYLHLEHAHHEHKFHTPSSLPACGSLGEAASRVPSHFEDLGALHARCQPPFPVVFSLRSPKPRKWCSFVRMGGLSHRRPLLILSMAFVHATIAASWLHSTGTVHVMVLPMASLDDQAIPICLLEHLHAALVSFRTPLLESFDPLPTITVRGYVIWEFLYGGSYTSY
ncbi:hypothetical protein VNO77_20064 [Canavalia gladiata]|uniref:Uncharacterized protein n=1 Tax=Canavalia gladiata TaxID=3824 RepID=A0AAN9LNN3_CANGL